MAGLDSSWGNDHFHRNEVFNTMLKQVLRDDLFAEQWVNYIGDFTDGSNYKINSVGELTVDQMAEATSLPDRRPDSGQFVFNINEFVGVKTAFTDVFIEDDFMANQVLATLPDRMTRAFEEYLETRVLRLQREQTNDDSNTINGAAHRFTANGTGRVITLNDLAYVNYALKKASVNRGAMIGIVDPSFEFNVNVNSQVQTSDNPQFRGIIESGIGSGFRFIRNIYGIDLYTSNYLDTEDAAETSLTDYEGNTTATVAGDVANIFFSASDSDTMPFIGAWRRRPVIRSWRDNDKETEYHQMSARFGLALYRPENLVTCMSSTTLNG
tara:strand:- start:4217 stop:5191 length:975 start_codon:yes stop_codon:yes gene_type:complete